MRVLITGASGSLGAYLVRHYAQSGHQVIAVIRNEVPEELEAYASVIRADLSGPIERFPDADIVIHSAALVSDSELESSLYRINVLGTEQVLAASTHIPVFVYISSSSVYSHLDRAQHESDLPDSPVYLNSAYGRSKWYAEQVVQSLNEGPISRYILRPRAIYGPGDRVLFPRIRRLRKGPFLILPGGLKAVTSLTHMKNLARVIDQILAEVPTSLERKVEIFNVADPEAYELGYVVKTLVGAAAGKRLITLGVPLGPLAFVARVLAWLGIRTRLTRFAIANFRKGQVLDTTALSNRFPDVELTSFEEEKDDVIAWARFVEASDGFRNNIDSLPWSGFKPYQNCIRTAQGGLQNV